MADGFDKFVDELQEEINEEVRREYSPNALDLIARQPNYGVMQDANAQGSSTDDTGKSIVFFLKVNANSVIEKATYTTTGCKPALACGSLVTLLIKGKTIEQSMIIDTEKIARALGKLPQEHWHYIDLAARALYEALNSFQDDTSSRSKKR